MTTAPVSPPANPDPAITRSEEPGGDDDRVVLAEERVIVTTQPVVTGRLRVRTHTDTTEEVVCHPLKSERIEVRHVLRDRPIAPGEPLPQVRHEGDVTILPIFEEVLVVETRLVLKEELHIIRHSTSDVAEVPVTLRRQRATVERLEGADASQTPNASPGIPTEDNP